MRIVICDDEPTQVQLLKGYIKDWAKGKESVLIDSFPSGEAFLFQYEENKMIDLLILDIEMKEMNGMELAKKLREENESPEIIFVTGYPDYVFEGYEVNAVSYLLKPLKEEQFCQCLDRAMKKITDLPLMLALEEGGSTFRIRQKDIMYLESRGHDVEVHTRDRCYISRRGITAVMQDLDKGEFMMPHRSYGINLAYIDYISKKEAVLERGIKIPLARGKWEELNHSFLIYCRGNQL